MSGTVHRNRPADRAGVVAASGVVPLLAGCGGTEPSALGALDVVEGGLSAAADRVDADLRAVCGSH